MHIISYVPRNERIMMTFFGKVDKTSEFYASLSDEGYFNSDYSEEYMLNPPTGATFSSSNWKDLDHYAILGLKNVRWRATQEKIKNAYRQRILAFHPDKGASTNENYLAELTSCINKSFEVLFNPTKRRSYDSVDPENDDSMPISAQVGKAEFFQVYGEAFERNSKWSNKQPVPRFGDENTDLRKVIEFYDFWYSFDSWREFSYHDKEDKEQMENRYQRRMLDKENKADREANRKKETLRIRKVVDDAYQRDFRVKLYLQQQRRVKEEMKKLKKQQKHSLNGTSTVVESQATLEKSRLFAAEKKNLQQNVQKFKNIPVDSVKSISDYLGQLSLDDAIFDKIKKLNRLNENGPHQTFRDEFFEEFDECMKFVVVERQDWTREDLQLLTKALNIFPNGYNDRWNQITRYVNSKAKEGTNFSVKSVMKMAKDLETFGDATAFFRRANSQVDVPDVGKKNGRPEECVWSKEEQKILEQALKTYPSSTAERWDKIAQCVTSKSKAECIERCKEILKKIKKTKK